MNLLEKFLTNIQLGWLRVIERLAIIRGDDVSRQEASCKYWALNNLMRKIEGQLESASGPGSTLDVTDKTRNFLQDYIQLFSIKTIVGIGCGGNPPFFHRCQK